MQGHEVDTDAQAVAYRRLCSSKARPGERGAGFPLICASQFHHMSDLRRVVESFGVSSPGSSVAAMAVTNKPELKWLLITIVSAGLCHHFADDDRPGVHSPESWRSVVSKALVLLQNVPALKRSE